MVPAKIFKDRHIMQTEQLRKEHFNVGQRYRLSKKKGVKINEEDEFFIINEQKQENNLSMDFNQRKGFTDSVAAANRLYAKKDHNDPQTIFNEAESFVMKSKRDENVSKQLSHANSVETMRSKITLTHRINHPQESPQQHKRKVDLSVRVPKRIRGLIDEPCGEAKEVA